MIYGSVCSGIEAATVAWKPLGWECAFVSEPEPFPARVLDWHYGCGAPVHPFKPTKLGPQTGPFPNFGDFTQIGSEHAGIDLLVGGTPCQAFSVAGLRGGLDDDRGNLALEYCRLAERLRARWLVWENVPGVLSSNEGRDFGALLGALAELGYGWAYRVLDAQYDGVAQRRRRVFLVAHSGGAWQRAAAVLFDSESLQRNPPPRQESGEVPARFPSTGPARRGGIRGRGEPRRRLIPDVAGTLCSEGRAAGSATQQSAHQDLLIPQVGHTLTAHANRQDGTVETFIPVDLAQVTSKTNRSNPQPGDPAPTLASTGRPAIAFNARQTPISGSVSPPLDTDGGTVAISTEWAVRRLTPTEWERLQGFPDGYTAIGADGHRYRAIGNSMAVPVMRWIGERIELVERSTKL